MLKSTQERIEWLRMRIEDRNNIDSAYQNILALKNDEGSLNKNRNHYSFSNMYQNNFTDFVMKKISSSLKQSKKASGITLFHGVVTDEGMKSFIDALSETKAPIKEVHIDDFPNITDASMKRLPEIIAQKGITTCKIGYCPGVSSELKKQINLACTNNQPQNVQTQLSQDNNLIL